MLEIGVYRDAGNLAGRRENSQREAAQNKPQDATNETASALQVNRAECLAHPYLSK